LNIDPLSKSYDFISKQENFLTCRIKRQYKKETSY
jgi:hypothetical protein